MVDLARHRLSAYLASDPYQSRWEQHYGPTEEEIRLRRYLMVGGGLLAGFLALRSPWGRRALSRLGHMAAASRTVGGTPPTLLETFLRTRHYRLENLERLLQTRYGLSLGSQMTEQIRQRLDEHMVERFSRRVWPAKALGLEPVTVHDVLEGPYRHLLPDRVQGPHPVDYGSAWNIPIRQALEKLPAEARKRMILDPWLLKGPEGVIDLRGFRGLWDYGLEQLQNIRVPFVGFSPYHILRIGERKAAREAFPLEVFLDRAWKGGGTRYAPQMILGRHPVPPQAAAQAAAEAGQTQPSAITKALEEAVGPYRLQEPMILIGRHLYALERLGEGPVATNVYGARYGAIPRFFARVMGIRTQHTGPDQRHPILKWFDIGRQEELSYWQRIHSVLTKEKHPRAFHNVVKRLADLEPTSTEAKSLRESLREVVEQHTHPLPDEWMDWVWPQLRKAVPGLFPDQFVPSQLKTQQDVVQALTRVLEYAHSPAGVGRIPKAYTDLLKRHYAAMFNSPQASPEEYLQGLRFLPLLSEHVPYELTQTTRSITRFADVKRDLQRALVFAAQQSGHFNVYSALEQLRDANVQRRLGIFPHDVAQIRGAYLAHVLDPQAGLRPDQLAQKLQEPESPLRAMLERHGRSLVKWYEMGPENPAPTEILLDAMQGSSLLIHPARPPVQWQHLAGFITQPKYRSLYASAMLEDLKGFVLQLAAGRGREQHITTATVAAYYPLLRLNEMLSVFGLGLSPEAMGSPLELAKNLLLKRWLLPQALLFYGGYLLWTLQGDQPQRNVAEGLKMANLLYAGIRDELGITSAFKYLKRLAPWSELIWELPGLGALDPTKSRAELEEFLMYGDTPVRKGRWWQLGNTPMQGGRIEYWRPSWYRLMASDYRFTDVMWGSREEYYENAWLPTPLYPEAPIRHFLTDPYHYELKHREDRPYVYSGPIPELQELPVIGPMVSATLGSILKPPILLHPEVFRDEAPQASSGGGMPPLAMARISTGGQIRLERYMPLPTEVEDTSAGSEAAGGPPLTILGGWQAARSRSRDVDLRLGGPGSLWLGEYGGSGGATQVQPGRWPDLASLPAIPLPQRLMDEPSPLMPENPLEPGSLRVSALSSIQSATDVLGLYGFGIRRALGPQLETPPTWQSSARMLQTQVGFGLQELGGFPGDLSEVYRRLLGRPQAYRPEKEINPIPNQMPDWLPGPEYYIDFQHGDPFSRIPLGEARLPGPGYEALNELHPDEYGGRYGLFDRFAILANVAPYSEQYRYYRDLLTRHQELIPPGLEDRFQEIKEQVSQLKKRERMYPYVFRDIDEVQFQSVHISRWLDNNTFLTEEYPDHPIRFAGIYVPSGQTDEAERARQLLQRMMPEGSEVRIGFRPPAEFADDTLQTLRAVVYDGGTNVNRYLLRRGLAKERSVDSPEAALVHFGSWEIAVGRVLESLAHLDTPFHTKFLQVRSPLEMWERKYVYGKEFQMWNFQDIVLPTFQSLIRHNPLVAAAYGFGYGWLMAQNEAARELMPWTGALLMGTAALARQALEDWTGRTFIPARRLRQWEIIEYFDILEYLKYRGLYAYAAERALAEEGFNAEAFFQAASQSGEENKEAVEALKEAKRQMLLAGVSRTDPQIKAINQTIKSLQGFSGPYPVGPWGQAAILFRQRYESTLYGADPYGPVTNILRAMPKQYREFFLAFSEAPRRDRERILETTPRWFRRFLEARWGMKVEERPDLEEYFRKHFLPPPDWEGWRPDKSLKDALARLVVSLNGVDPEEFDIWPSDVQHARAVNAPVLPYNRPTRRFGSLDRNLRSILEGMGLRNVRVEFIAKMTPQFEVELDLDVDRTSEIQAQLEQHPDLVLQ